MPTRNPVLPRSRVGIMSCTEFAVDRLFPNDVTAPDAREAIDPAARPAATDAAPALRKPRRVWLAASCGGSFGFMSLLHAIQWNTGFVEYHMRTVRVYLSQREGVNRYGRSSSCC